MTLDISQRLQIGGGNEMWLGLFLELDLGHARLTFGFGLAERISKETAELLCRHSLVDKQLQQSGKHSSIDDWRSLVRLGAKLRGWRSR